MLPGKSPGGSDEKTGKASALSERLTMGTVDVIGTEPVKLLSLGRGPMLAAPCAFRGQHEASAAQGEPGRQVTCGDGDERGGGGIA